MKDPAFLFYPNDYLGGTLGMTFEEKGAYIELLMTQFNRGHMTLHMIGQILGQNMDKIWPNIKQKFKLDSEGNYFNERLELEQNKRKAYSESRKNNIKGINQYTKKRKKKRSYDQSMTSHMEDRNENRIIYENINKKTWEKWILFKKDQFKFTYKSISSEQTALNQLIELSANNDLNANKIIDQSIANGWKGLFEIKSNGKSTEKQEPYQPNYKKFSDR